jgi:hypothetical protein
MLQAKLHLEEQGWRVRDGSLKHPSSDTQACSKCACDYGPNVELRVSGRTQCTWSGPRFGAFGYKRTSINRLTQPKPSRMTGTYGPAAFRKRDCARIAEVADCIPPVDRLAGRGLDGKTHTSLVSLADRLASNHLRHQTLNAFIDPFHAFSQSRTRGRSQTAITS